ncbi:MAG: S46 family peptidase, partial [Thermoguttaceae bacterium]|nr:S46 family peptidase [Thermoguttaceae bacterium]
MGANPANLESGVRLDGDFFPGENVFEELDVRLVGAPPQSMGKFGGDT